MTVIVPLKVGEVLVPKGSSWSGWKQVKLVSTHEFKGRMYWWLEMTSRSDATHLDTLSEDVLRGGWKRAATFYRIGKKYKFEGGYAPDVYEVIELHQVENAIDSGNAKAAVAYCAGKDGKRMLTVLNANDFRFMVEA